MKKKICILVLFLCCTQGLLAREYERFGESFRSLALGGTGVAASKFGNAMFYNPAALGNIITSFWDIGGLHIEQTDLTLIDHLTDFTGKDPSKQADLLYEHVKTGLYYKSRGESSFNINFTNTGGNFGGNYYLSERISMLPVELDDSDVFIVDVERVKDIVSQFGFSLPFFSGAFVLGYTHRTIDREYQSLVFNSSTDTVEDLKAIDDTTSGTATSESYGFIWRFPYTSLRPTIGYTIQNAGGIKFDNPNIPEIKSETAYGISINPVVGRFRYLFAVDVRDTESNFDTSNDTENSDKRTHLGFEMAFSISNSLINNTIALRAGSNQGLITYGAEVSMGLTRQFIFGYTNYSENLSTNSNDAESRRTIYYISFGI